ncbi:MAG: hypothetical protein GY847_01515 [Proteobacteria bacterium]|nr:hypothetical protein [Pseudomonadota bacterium]
MELQNLLISIALMMTGVIVGFMLCSMVTLAKVASNRRLLAEIMLEHKTSILTLRQIWLVAKDRTRNGGQDETIQNIELRADLESIEIMIVDQAPWALEDINQPAQIHQFPTRERTS